MAKRDMLKNGLTLRNISIVVGILLAAGSILWAFAIQSEGFTKDIEYVIENAKETDAEVSAMDMQLGSIQKAVTITQTDVKYIKEDIAKLEKLTTKIWDKMNE